MPIKESAKKYLRQTKKHRILNIARQKAVKDLTKKITKLLAAGQKDEAKNMISAVYKAIDKAAKRGVIKKNTAARKKSRLMALINK
ncbi:MAG: 30S ribosomal protein S20 [Candidatus Portnoybacteria bacterium]|nr:30S ribosomal protein S20 [Candidatus Portnoybacteria bacterium]